MSEVKICSHILPEIRVAPTPQSIDSALAGAAPTNRLATPAVASATIAVDVYEQQSSFLLRLTQQSPRCEVIETMNIDLGTITLGLGGVWQTVEPGMINRAVDLQCRSALRRLKEAVCCKGRLHVSVGQLAVRRPKMMKQAPTLSMAITKMSRGMIGTPVAASVGSAAGVADAHGADAEDARSDCSLGPWSGTPHRAVNVLPETTVAASRGGRSEPTARSDGAVHVTPESQLTDTRNAVEVSPWSYQDTTRTFAWVEKEGR